MSFLQRAVLVMALCVIPVYVFAARTEFIVASEGERLAGSEVCFFPSVVDDGFFQKFLTSSDVRCLPADRVIQMPLGNWNIFANHGGTHTSTHPTSRIADSETEEERRGYHQITMRVQPAASLRLPDATAESRPVVYFPNLNRPGEPASIRPALRGAERVLVPAATPVVPLLVRGLRILQVGAAVSLPAGTAADATFPESIDRRAVVALLRVPGSPDDGDDREDDLDVHLESAGEAYKPLVGMRSGWAIDHSLLIFRDVPLNEATVVIGGRRWKPLRIQVPAGSEPVTELPPIVLQRSGEIQVAWKVPAADAIRPCRLSASGSTMAKPIHLVVSRCVSDRSCTDVDTVTLPDEARDGDQTLAGLEAGTYRVTLRHPTLGETTGDVQVATGHTVDLPLLLEPVRIIGMVTDEDRPILADVSFVTGLATTDASGAYTALLPKAPGAETVTVVPCDDRAPYAAIPPEPLLDGSRFDIVIPDTEVRFRVIEAVSGKPIKGAGIALAVLLGQEDIERHYLDVALTGADGVTSVSRVPRDVWLRACASQAGYSTRCADAFILKGDQRRTVVKLELSREETMRGRILAGGPIINGTLFWLTSEGAVLERRVVAEDGTFRDAAAQQPTAEYLVFVAASHPLHMFEMPRGTRSRALELALAPKAVHVFEIMPGAVKEARIALEVDGRIVPEQVFAAHQTMRGKSAAVYAGERVPVAGIAAERLVVLAGPSPNFIPVGAPPSNDLSAVPHFRVLFRRLPVRGGAVELTER